MVKHAHPQRSNTMSILTNSDYPPQGRSVGGGISPGVDSELVEEVAGVIDTLIYDDGDTSGFVLVQET